MAKGVATILGELWVLIGELLNGKGNTYSPESGALYGTPCSLV